MSGADGGLLADVTDDFTKEVKALGPLGKSEGIDEKGLRFKLEAARKLVPYIKLVERERLRVPYKSKEAYHEFFTSDEFDRLFAQLIGEKLAVSQMMLLLKESPLSTGEIAKVLSLKPSDISRYMKSSSKHGFVRYDVSRKRYALA